MIKYPEKPWVDKQTFTHTTQAGDEIAGIYDAPTNTWSFYKGNSDLVFTNTVYTVDVKPADASIARAGQLFNDALPLPGVDNLVTQQDVNWYLYDLINSIDGGSQIWVGLDEPPGTDNDNPITKFWWKDDEEQLYVWDTIALEWKLTGLMDFDRPELEEEIDAIAPSVERGEWNFNPLVASPSHYTLLKGDGSNTDIFSQARLIFVSTTDADSNPHGFNNHEPGELLQIFNKNDDEYGLYEITDIDDNSSNSQNPYFSFTVDFVRAYSSTGKAVDRGRFKFFNAPTGGTADGFVLKTGDTMEGPGPLTIKTKKNIK